MNIWSNLWRKKPKPWVSLLKQIFISSGHRGIAKLLLENGANINTKTDSNKTALSLASLSGNFHIIISCSCSCVCEPF